MGLEERIFDLFFDLKTFLNLSNDQLPHDKNFKDPTIDLTWFCKKDFDLKTKITSSPLFFLLILISFSL